VKLRARRILPRGGKEVGKSATMEA